MNILFWLTSFNNYILCWIMAWNVHVPLPTYITILVKIGPNIEEMVLAPFRKWNSFNNSRIDGKFGIHLYDSKVNTLETLALANVSQLLCSTWKHYHTQWSPYIIQWFMYYAIVKYRIQGLECVKQGINQICAKCHIFPKITKWVLFLEKRKYHLSQF